MAAKRLSGIIEIARQMLRNEFKVDEKRDWTPEELTQIALHCLVDMSKSSPRQVKETVKTSAGSVDLDISSIERLGIADVEYPVGNNPRTFRNFSVFGNTLTMEMDLLPSANQDVYLYCNKVHQLTDSASSLSPQLEHLLILGITGNAAVNKSLPHINKKNIGGKNVFALMHRWGLAQLAFYKQGLLEEEEANQNIDHARN